jgi:predicted nucleic acid-binding protein
MLVVDTNIVAYLYLDAAYLDLMQALLERDGVWVAPTLWRSDLRSVLLTYLQRNLITMEGAVEVIVAAEERLGAREYYPASPQVLALAHSSGCSAYNCEYVALAQEIGTVLVTFDRKILAAFPTIAMTPSIFLRSTASY